MNLPNRITLIRIFLVPVFIIMFLIDFPYHYTVAVLIFIAASVTDFIDGYLARKMNLVTDLGKFLDPFADKALVCSACVLITSFQNICSLPVMFLTVIIIVRELMITAFRTVAARKKVVLAADILGKIKTCLQMTGLIIYMLYPDMHGLSPVVGDIVMYIGFVCLALATVFAVISACNYIIKNKRVLSENDDNRSLAKKIIESNPGTIAVAESFTGGNVCADIVSVPGASKCFVSGKVCYSNAAKTDDLGISADIISTYGAVSHQTAELMLIGLKERSGANYAVITTGNAGPTAEKEGEQGICFIGVAGKKESKVIKYCFSGSRDEVIQSGTYTALKLLLDVIQSETI